MISLTSAQAVFDAKPRSQQEIAQFNAWKAKRQAAALRHRAGRIEFARGNWAAGAARLDNVRRIALGLTEKVKSGQVSVGQAITDLLSLQRHNAESEGLLDGAIEQIEAVTAADPVRAYEASISRFPALAARLAEVLPFEP